MTYGMLSAATKQPGLEEGVNLGGSMNAVGADDLYQAAMVPFLAAMATVVAIPARALLSSLMPETVYPVGSADAARALKQVAPSMAAPWIEKLTQSNENVGMASSGEGDTRRTEAGQRSYYATGKKSVTESKEGTRNYIIKQENQQAQAEIKSLVGWAADYAENNRDVNIESIRRRATQLGLSASEFDEKVVDAIIKRRTTTRQREAEKSTSRANRSQRERSEME